MINKLTLKCKFADNGCLDLKTMSDLKGHEENCTFDTDGQSPFPCEEDCGCMVTLRTVQAHVCKEALKAKVTKLEEEVGGLTTVNEQLRVKIMASEESNQLNVTKLQEELNMVKGMMGMSVTGTRPKLVVEQPALVVSNLRAEASDWRAAEAAPPPKLPCKYFVKGMCVRGDLCPFSHDIAIVEPPKKCKYFIFGNCERGNECLYVHDDHERL
jgi:hypothetical protein